MATTLAPLFQPEPAICEVGGSGVILPLFDVEQEWDKIARAFLYFMLLGWCFLGVAIISDIFMEAIEAVTSRRRTYVLGNGQEISTKVWNDTVANLSLMALGSSAPEIMLNVIEICLRDFFSGDLGPSTIVGSAAFNLMVIIAVCVFVIPEGEFRTITSPEPFLVTAFFSIFAYGWMVVVVSWSTPDVVTIPEAIVTFLFFPILITVSYLADIGMFSCAKDVDEDENLKFIQEKVQEAGYELSAEDIKLLSKCNTAELGKSRAAARISASPVRGHGISEQELSMGFISSKYCFAPGQTQMTLTVQKFGGNDELVNNARISFEYRTSDGNMKTDDGDYIPAASFGEISAGELFGEITIMRKAGDPSGAANGSAPAKKENLERSNYFYVEIVQASKLAGKSGPTNGNGNGKRASTMTTPLEQERGLPIGIATRRAQVAIADISGPGQLRMDTDKADIPCPETDTLAKIKVRRTGGSDGEISCRYVSVEDSAKVGTDFMAIEGTLCFGPGVVEQTIEVPIMRKVDPDSQDTFTIVISPMLESRTEDIVAGQSKCEVTIWDDSSDGINKTNQVLRALDSSFNVNNVIDSARDWADQFILAFNPRGGDEEDAEEATVSEWTMHFIALPWKLLFAFTPPPSYCGGWLSFTVALLMIGGVTVFIGDLATLIGCVMNINSSITAITIVALGTSLPDMFASKVSAVEDPSADAAIGNVTGSNSVNVFLGLGLPWVIGSLYWNAKGKTPEWIYRYPKQHAKYAEAGLVVVGGDLTFSVIVFSLCAVTVLSVIWYRRRTFEAELGGPVGAKMNTSIFLILLWMFYVSMASWKVIEGEVPFGKCVMAVFVGLMLVAVGVMLVAGLINLMNYKNESRRNEMKEIFDACQEHHDAALGIARPSLTAKGNGRFSVSSPAKRPSAVSFPGSQTEALLAATQLVAERGPALAEGLRLKMPEAVTSLRRHLEALNLICKSLESHTTSGELRAGATGDDVETGRTPPSLKPVRSPQSVDEDETPSKQATFDDAVDEDEEANDSKVRKSLIPAKVKRKKKAASKPEATAFVNEDEKADLLDGVGEYPQ